jgi:uncharacterized membrane protein YhaH (DUF805 family)
VGLTNSREAAAFFVARAVVVAIYFVITPLLLAPLYIAVIRSGGSTLMTLVTTSISFVTWLVTLVLFLALRGGFGGVPAMVAGQGRRDAVTSSGGEIAAFLVAALVAILFVWAASVFVLAQVYVSLRQSGQAMWVTPVALGLSAVAAVVFFVIFIALRGAMPGAAAAEAEGAIETYDDGGGASMGFGQAIATCFRKYAVFSGRASRSEYWFFVLFQILLLIALMIVDALTFRGAVNVFATLAMLILFLPGLAVTVRRLHDVDMSGWFVLLGFIPVVSLIMLVWLCQRGTDGANRYGMGPAGAAIPEVFA